MVTTTTEEICRAQVIHYCVTQNNSSTQDGCTSGAFSSGEDSPFTQNSSHSESLFFIVKLYLNSWLHQPHGQTPMKVLILLITALLHILNKSWQLAVREVRPLSSQLHTYLSSLFDSRIVERFHFTSSQNEWKQCDHSITTNAYTLVKNYAKFHHLSICRLLIRSTADYYYYKHVNCRS